MDIRDVINNPVGRPSYPKDTMLVTKNGSGTDSGVDSEQLENLTNQINQLSEAVDMLYSRQQMFTLDAEENSSSHRTSIKLIRHVINQPDAVMGSVTLPYGTGVGHDSTSMSKQLTQVVPYSGSITKLFSEQGNTNYIDSSIKSYVEAKKVIVHQASELNLPVNSNSTYKSDSRMSGLPNNYLNYLKQTMDFSVCVGTSTGDTLLNLAPVNNTEAGNIVTTLLNVFDHHFNHKIETVQENDIASTPNFTPHKYHIKVTANIAPRKQVSQDDWVKLNRISSFIVKKDMALNNYGTAIEEALANYVGDITFRAEIEYFNGFSNEYLERYTSN